MIRHLRRTLTAGLLLVAAAGCGSDPGTGPTATGRVRFVHAVEGFPTLQLDLAATTAGASLAFGTASDYFTVNQGAYTFRITAPSGSVSFGTPIAGNLDQTIVAYGDQVGVGANITNDDPPPPAAGQIKIRVLHGIRSLGALDVHVVAPGAAVDPNAPVFANLPYTNLTAYSERPAGTYQIVVTLPAAATELLRTAPQDLPAGAVRTVVLAGNATQVTAITLVD
ncbi:MAG: DUF4397 domain-containing protein [Gemmatimonadota bacterium]